MGRYAGLRRRRNDDARGPRRRANAPGQHVAVSYHRRARRDAQLGHGGWAQRELCSPRPLAREGLVAIRAVRAIETRYIIADLNAIDPMTKFASILETV